MGFQEWWKEHIEEPVGQGVESIIKPLVVDPVVNTVQHVDTTMKALNPIYLGFTEVRDQILPGNPLTGANPFKSSPQENAEAFTDTALFALNFVPGIGWVDDAIRVGKNIANVTKVGKHASRLHKQAKAAQKELDVLNRVSLLDGISAYEKHVSQQGYKTVPWKVLYDDAIRNPSKAGALREWADPVYLQRMEQYHKAINKSKEYQSFARQYSKDVFLDTFKTIGGVHATGSTGPKPMFWNGSQSTDREDPGPHGKSQE